MVLLIGFLSFFVTFAAPFQVGQVVLVDTPQVGATQEQVGYRAVDRMIEYWTKDCKDLACVIDQFRKNVVEKPVPGFVSPPLDGTSTGPKVYITDGHHRASALDRLMHGKLSDLPPNVQKLLGAGGQNSLISDPTFRLSVRIEAMYPTRSQAALGMAALGKGQLSVESRQAVAGFEKALHQVKMGQPADVNMLLAAYKNLPTGLGGLDDSPLRSAVGTVFFNLGLDSVDYVDYIEFHVAEALEKQGLKLLPGDVLSNANVALVQHAILREPSNVSLIQKSVLPHRAVSAKKTNVWPILEDARKGILPKSSVVDVVYDIDQTIATLVHEGPGGDWLADPKDPKKNVYEVTFDRIEVDTMNRPLVPKKVTRVTESYRVYDGFVEQMEKWRKEISAGKVRVSFFSGGHVERNRALLEAVKLSDGTSVRDMVSEANIYGRESMVATGVGPEGRVRERFKKDLRIINPDLSQVILVDDIPNFVPNSQLEHVLWLDEDFPYPERLGGRPMVTPSPERIQRERDKFKKISAMLDDALELHRKEGVSFSKAVRRGLGTCKPQDIFPALNQLLEVR
jgi:hypothetical protein